MDFTNKTIGEIVAEDFRTAAIFKKHGIDFCCRGGRTIEEACEKKKSYGTTTHRRALCFAFWKRR